MHPFYQFSAKCDNLGGKFFERANGTKVCYTIEDVKGTSYNYETAKQFCEAKDGLLPEIKSPVDQLNMEKLVANRVDKMMLFIC